MKLALWEYKPKTHPKKTPQNKTQQPKQSSTSLNYSNDSESYDPKTRITRPQKNDKGSTQMFKSQEKTTRWLMNMNSPEPPFYPFFRGGASKIAEIEKRALHGEMEGEGEPGQVSRFFSLKRKGSSDEYT